MIERTKEGIQRTHGCGNINQNRYCMVCNKWIPREGNDTTVIITTGSMDFIGMLCSLGCMFKYHKNEDGYKGRRKCQSVEEKQNMEKVVTEKHF